MGNKQVELQSPEILEARIAPSGGVLSAVIQLQLEIELLNIQAHHQIADDSFHRGVYHLDAQRRTDADAMERLMLELPIRLDPGVMRGLGVGGGQG